MACSVDADVLGVVDGTTLSGSLFLESGEFFPFSLRFSFLLFQRLGFSCFSSFSSYVAHGIASLLSA